MFKLKDMPKVVYLQVEDQISSFTDLGECTWCVDKINKSDIAYVLKISRNRSVRPAFKKTRSKVSQEETVG